MRKLPEKKSSAPLSFKPVVVLLTICVVIAALLAGVNAVTAPILEVRKADELAASLRTLLPDATTYTELECDIERVTAVYRDDNGTGYAVITTANGYHGEITVTTAFGPDGRIIGVSVDASHETVGVGTRTGEPEFAANFVGLSGSVDDVAVLTGATVSSKAVLRAVNSAIAAYEQVREG